MPSGEVLSLRAKSIASVPHSDPSKPGWLRIVGNIAVTNYEWGPVASYGLCGPGTFSLASLTG
ncbi:hypothetical protein GCM10010277_66290 [Streptomyces longisporoflavus]|nr:hypothetical protein GCM10010277_66290 [Streptomyces longisporoflavus]